jgi:hypothetical protein
MVLPSSIVTSPSRAERLPWRSRPCSQRRREVRLPREGGYSCRCARARLRGEFASRCKPISTTASPRTSRQWLNVSVQRTSLGPPSSRCARSHLRPDRHQRGAAACTRATRFDAARVELVLRELRRIPLTATALSGKLVWCGASRVRAFQRFQRAGGFALL